MRPPDLKTRIFVDGGDPEETREIQKLLGFLDGQTTNPTLISKNPRVTERLDRGEKFTSAGLLDYYREVVTEISAMLPAGSVSVEVYADLSTKSSEMLAMGREMFSWIPNAHIKFPSSSEGIEAARQAVAEGMRVNMTLCFSQSQAAAVYAATRGAKRGDVFVSPFIGRLDDRGENGMDLIRNIIAMYREGDGHVEVLAASVRNLNQLLSALKLASDIISSPAGILKTWAQKGCPIPTTDFEYRPEGLKPMPYEHVSLLSNWQDYDVSHQLTIKGMEKFSQDWNKLIKP